RPTRPLGSAPWSSSTVTVDALVAACSGSFGGGAHGSVVAKAGTVAVGGHVAGGGWAAPPFGSAPGANSGATNNGGVPASAAVRGYPRPGRVRLGSAPCSSSASVVSSPG